MYILCIATPRRCCCCEYLRIHTVILSSQGTRCSHYVAILLVLLLATIHLYMGVCGVQEVLQDGPQEVLQYPHPGVPRYPVRVANKVLCTHNAL